MKKFSIYSFFMLALFILVGNLFPQAPQLLNYQGRLVDNAGKPLDGNYSVKFSIYSAPTGGTTLWTETQTVAIAKGVFNVLLGSVSTLPATLFTGAGDRYLGMKVGTDSEMPDRFRIVSVAYAIRSTQADGVADRAITEAKIDNNAVTSVKILDGTLTNRDIADEPGMAEKSDGTTSVQITDVNSILVEHTINVPTNGYVLVIGKCQGRINHVNGTNSSANFGVSNSAASLPADQDNLWQVPSAAPSGTYESVICTQKIFPVNAGSVKFYLLGRKSSGAALATILAWDRTLSLVFFPTAYGSVSSAANNIQGFENPDAEQIEQPIE